MNWYPAMNLVKEAGDYRIAGCLSSKRCCSGPVRDPKLKLPECGPMAQARAAFRIHRDTSAARGSPRIKRSWPSSCMRRCHYLKQQTEIALDPTLHSRGGCAEGADGVVDQVRHAESFEQDLPPRPLHNRKLRDIFLVSRPPLLARSSLCKKKRPISKLALGKQSQILKGDWPQ